LYHAGGTGLSLFLNHQTGLSLLSMCILGNPDRSVTLTLCHLKRCKLFTSTMSKNPTERFKLRQRNKTHMAVFTGKPHNSWPLNPYFALFRALDWATDAKGRRIFTLALALRVLTYQISCGCSRQSVNKV
jgi:hypothetical protein